MPKTGFLNKMGSLLYGNVEGVLDTVSFGLTDTMTDKLWENTLNKGGAKNLNQFRGAGNIAGAVGGGILTGNVSGAINEGLEGFGDIAGNSKNADFQKAEKFAQLGAQVASFMPSGGSLTNFGSQMANVTSNPMVSGTMGQLNSFVSQSGSQPKQISANVPKDVVYSRKQDTNFADGGPIRPRPIFVSNLNDPKLRSYNDSLNLYRQNFNQLKSERGNRNISVEFVRRVPFDMFMNNMYAADAFEKNDVEDTRSMGEVYPERIKPAYFDINNLIYKPGTAPTHRNSNSSSLHNIITRHSAYYKKPVQPIKYANPVIVEKQKLLKDAGLYTGELDGMWGPKSEEAWKKYNTPTTPETPVKSVPPETPRVAEKEEVYYLDKSTTPIDPRTGKLNLKRLYNPLQYAGQKYDKYGNPIMANGGLVATPQMPKILQSLKNKTKQFENGGEVEDPVKPKVTYVTDRNDRRLIMNDWHRFAYEKAADYGVGDLVVDSTTWDGRIIKGAANSKKYGDGDFAYLRYSDELKNDPNYKEFETCTTCGWDDEFKKYQREYFPGLKGHYYTPSGESYYVWDKPTEIVEYREPEPPPRVDQIWSEQIYKPGTSPMQGNTEYDYRYVASTDKGLLEFPNKQTYDKWKADNNIDITNVKVNYGRMPVFKDTPTVIQYRDGGEVDDPVKPGLSATTILPMNPQQFRQYVAQTRQPELTLEQRLAQQRAAEYARRSNTQDKTKVKTQQFTKEERDNAIPQKTGLLKVADVVTDVAQLGNFLPHPLAQRIGLAGNYFGGLIDSYQAINDFSNADYGSGLINLTSAALPAYLGTNSFRRNSKYLKPGQLLYPLSSQANNLPGNARTYYIEPFNRVRGMTKGNLRANRALLGTLGAETIYDAYKKGGMIKRADGSYSKRGLWDNIRANRGSGKKPTAEMLKQERKIKRNS